MVIPPSCLVWENCPTAMHVWGSSFIFLIGWDMRMPRTDVSDVLLPLILLHICGKLASLRSRLLSDGFEQHRFGGG